MSYLQSAPHPNQLLLFSDAPDWLLEASEAPPERLLELCADQFPCHVKGRNECLFIATCLRKGYYNTAKARQELKNRMRDYWIRESNKLAESKAHPNTLHALMLLLNFINR